MPKGNFRAFTQKPMGNWFSWDNKNLKILNEMQMKRGKEKRAEQQKLQNLVEAETLSTDRMDSAQQNEEKDLHNDCEGSKVEHLISQEFTEKGLHEDCKGTKVEHLMVQQKNSFKKNRRSCKLHKYAAKRPSEWSTTTLLSGGDFHTMNQPKA